MTVRRVAAWTGYAVALFAVTYYLILGKRTNLVDESWMLWVTKRMTSGDRLYSGVYFVSTPLGAWVSAGFALVGGVHLTVLRVLEVAIFVAEFLVAVSVARWCRISWPSLVLFGVALFVVGTPANAWISVYSSVAVLFALVALRVLLVWFDHRADAAAARTRMWVLVGIGTACGLSFASKPNVGVLALGATLVGIWLNRDHVEGERPTRALLVVGGGFVAVLVLMAVPILATGAWSEFVSNVFADKGDYIRVGTSYFTTLENQSNVIGAFFTEGERSLRVLHAVTVLLPIVLVLIVAWAVLRTREAQRRQAVLLGLFTIAALLSMFPRPGSNHLAGVAPLAFVGTLGAVTASKAQPSTQRVRQVAFGLTGVVLAAALVVIVVHSVTGYSDPLVTRSGYTHFEHTAVPKRFRPGVEDIRRFVRDSTDGRVFILREDAGFWYLTTGTRDPLPFDIPEVSDFGAGDQQGVIRRLRRGEADWVCLKPVEEEGNGPLEPRKIERWVRGHFEFVESIRQCDMFRRPG